MSGGAGDDILNGGLGADRLTGGLGNDTYTVGSVNTIVTERISEGNDIVNSTVSFALGANLERLTLVGKANIKGFGNTLDNFMLGNSVDNALDGLAGDDVISGLDGKDILKGGSGKDILNGGEGNDELSGGSGNDELSGEDGSDSLDGGAGSDRLNGFNNDASNSEQDRLSGGISNDTFVLGFNSGSLTQIGYSDFGNADFAILTDFSAAQVDKIRIGGAISEYTLNKTQSVKGIGSNAIDTQIFRNNELIAVVQDNTDVVINRDFVI